LTIAGAEGEDPAMKRAMVAVIASATACATPYQEMGMRGGVEAHPIGDGSFAVHARVNGFTSHGTALEYAHRRASEACPGGYDVMDRATSAKTSYWVSENSVSRVDKPEVTLIVRCRE
jgi:hypothetical protein